LRSYRRKETHAGYARYTISRKPAYYDDDGNRVTSPSPYSSEDERLTPWQAKKRTRPQPIIDDAFGDIKLEILLRPLTAASELANHPSLSVAYTSTALTKVVAEAQEMVRRQRETLWRAKRLLLRFRGDAEWMPCGVFESGADEMLLASEGPEAGSAAASVMMPELEAGDSASMQGVETLDMALQQGAVKAVQDQDHAAAELAKNDGEVQIMQDAGIEDNMDNIERENGDATPASDQNSTSSKPAQNQPHAMTTRTRARARTPLASPSRSPSPSSTASTPQIHPWFQIPASSLPDRDVGLPAQEAEETRRLLLLYVQKEEQVLRSLTSLADGLMRAERLRKAIWRAAKAEGHCRPDPARAGAMRTEMSDGEDWVDIESLGLGKADVKMQKDGSYGLEKGKDEVEDVEEEGRRVGGRRRRVARM